LNTNPTVNITTPKIKPEATNLLIKYKVKISELNKVRSEKESNPVKPYIKDIPKSIKPEEKDPSIKYFNPDSVENEECCLEATIT
jgi:hypothetical protein